MLSDKEIRHCFGHVESIYDAKIQYLRPNAWDLPYHLGGAHPDSIIVRVVANNTATHSNCPPEFLNNELELRLWMLTLLRHCPIRKGDKDGG